MKTSARNHFAGTVTSIRAGAINDEIEIEAGAGLRIVATVTRESREELGLEIGREAFALVKASSILLLTDGADVKLSARNQLAGTVMRVAAGAVNTEIELALASGASIVAIVTDESARSLALRQGSPATAMFKASSVIVGVKA